MAEYVDKKHIYGLFNNTSGVIRLHVAEVDNLPAADVAPVVRCGNCSKRPEEVEYGMCRVLWRITHKNDFCSYGERKG